MWGVKAYLQSVGGDLILWPEIDSISLLSEDSESDLVDPEIDLSTNPSPGSFAISAQGGDRK